MNRTLLQQRALELLRSATNEYGILASPDPQENYRRLWARDSIIAGIAGLLAGDEEVITGLRSSLATLADHQHERGMIPSNVLTDSDNPQISYGGLAGRVDATTWFMVGSGLYLRHHPDDSLSDRLRPALAKCHSILSAWEYNARDLIYTPLSGNWADEYPIEGHTLYDNLLRLWGLELYGSLWDDSAIRSRAKRIRSVIASNFWPGSDPDPDEELIYHKRAYREQVAKARSCFACAVSPRGYDNRFDAAGNALALLLGIGGEDQADTLSEFSEKLFSELGRDMIPAFWPVITPGDPDWNSLRLNFSYAFKNEPHHFHNGGIWPVWMGWYGLGLCRRGFAGLARRLLDAWITAAGDHEALFGEYLNSQTFEPGGKERLAFSAAGLVLLDQALEENFESLLVPET